MKTRTLLLLSVGTALLILFAGGALFYQLSTQDAVSESTPLNTETSVGDATITVLDSTVVGEKLAVSVEIGGVDDLNGIDSFRLVTGDQRLDPIAAPGDGRCTGITAAPQKCVVEFDVSATSGSSRVLVMRRGDEQATWRLG